MTYSLWLSVHIAVLLKIGLVGKFLLTHHIQCQAIQENKKMFLGRRLHSGVKFRTFTPACSCLPEYILLNSVATKAVKLKSKKSLFGVLNSREKMHYSSSEY
jgi:hypothetical protein